MQISLRCVCVPIPLRFNNSTLNTLLFLLYFVISLCHMYIINSRLLARYNIELTFII